SRRSEPIVATGARSRRAVAVGSSVQRRARRQHRPENATKSRRLRAKSARKRQVTVCYKASSRRARSQRRVAAPRSRHARPLVECGEYGGFVDRIRDETLEL